MKIKDIVIKKELLARKKADKEFIVKYGQVIEDLPPIKITKDNVLIDGLHRLSAHKDRGIKEIDVEIIDVEEEEILAASYRFNSEHGKPHTFKERDELIWKLSKDNPESEYNWTQQKIADKMGLSQQRVSAVLLHYSKINNSKNKDSENKQLPKTKAEITEAKIKLSEEELKEELGREPKDTEIADRAEVTKGRVSQIKKKQKKEEERKQKEKNLKRKGEEIPYFWSREFPKLNKLTHPFTLTDYPFDDNDAVCPHFVELKWAYECPFECSWCYLLGAFRGKKKGKVKDGVEVTKAILEFFDNKELKERNEVLNTGELSDSIAVGGKSLQILMLCLFAEQVDTEHKILFLTKSDSVEHLLYLPNKIKKNAIISFSINEDSVAERWEKKAPKVEKRLEAARKLFEVGYKVRLRIDPIVPIDDWKRKYKRLIDSISFIPDRITIGSLRVVNQKTISFSKDKTWEEYLDKKEKTGWGLKIGRDKRKEINKFIIKEIRRKWKGIEIGMCKETREMWEELDLDWRNIKCNCVL